MPTPANSPGRCPLGITDELPDGKQNTGRINLGGCIATAGGLVFIGATNDNRFRAFDSKTGKELWVTKLDYSAIASPMTFHGKNGKQYVAIYRFRRRRHHRSESSEYRIDLCFRAAIGGGAGRLGAKKTP